MPIIVLIMLCGIATGFFMRSRRLKNINSVITVLIWLLLFILGIEVGGNKEIINNLASLGLESLIIATAGVLGSIIAAWGLWKITYQKSNKKEQ